MTSWIWIVVTAVVTTGVSSFVSTWSVCRAWRRWINEHRADSGPTLGVIKTQVEEDDEQAV